MLSLRKDDEMNEELETQAEPLIVCTQHVSNHYKIMISQSFGEVQNYDSAYNTLLEATEDDVVEFVINTFGGNYYALTQLISGIMQTDAHTIATITGTAASCGSMLALSCLEIRVLPMGEILIHNGSASSPTSKIADSVKATLFLSKQMERSFRMIYAGFLTEEEIVQCLNGAEMHMDSDEINGRLEKLQEYRESMVESQTAVKH
jgi:ATP-dependent protease ClpP protease subunit